MVTARESKMISVLFSNDHFIATFAYPIKNKVTLPISKKQTATVCSVDAAVEICPVIHGHTDGLEIAKLFQTFISHEVGPKLTKNGEETLKNFLELCGDKTRKELLEGIALLLKELPKENIDHLFINLIDAAGNLIVSSTTSLQNLLRTIEHMKNKIVLWKAPKKRSTLLVAPHAEKGVKARRKERLHGEKEGGTCRYRNYGNKRVA